MINLYLCSDIKRRLRAAGVPCNDSVAADVQKALQEALEDIVRRIIHFRQEFDPLSSKTVSELDVYSAILDSPWSEVLLSQDFTAIAVDALSKAGMVWHSDLMEGEPPTSLATPLPTLCPMEYGDKKKPS